MKRITWSALASAGALAAALLMPGSPAGASIALTQPMAWGNNPPSGILCTSHCQLTPAAAGPAGAVSVDAENTFDMAIMPDGTLWAWGGNNQGQLGNGSTVRSNTPVQVQGLTSVTDVGGGDNDGIALESSGSVWTWGNDNRGQLGNGAIKANTDVPAQVNLPGPAIQVDAGGFHDYALLADGTVWSWGWGVNGQLGNGSQASSDVPQQIPGLSGIIQISSGNQFGFALAADGTVYSWGYNRYGQLCQGSTVNQDAPQAVPGLTGVTQIGAGGWLPADGHVLLLMAGGTVQACGDNASGQLGTGTTTSSSVPVAVTGLSGITEVSAGGVQSLALDASGNVWAWGDNTWGQVGNSSQQNSDVPVQVLSNASDISGGAVDSLALTAGS